MKKKYIKQLVILLLILMGYLNREIIQKSDQLNVIPESIATIASSSATFIVDHVIDGDTFAVMVNGKKETVRLIGIDTPEVVDPRKPVQCYGKEASNKAKELLTGKTIRLTNDPTQGERDKYKRFLRYAFLEDGTNFNEFMIREGYAHEYTYQSNPYRYQTEFKEAEIFARENKKGLWADGVCN